MVVYILTINVPVAHMVRYIMILMGKIHFESQWKGWALKIETFLGPEMSTSEAISIWAQKKSRFSGSTPSSGPSNGFAIYTVNNRYIGNFMYMSLIILYSVLYVVSFMSMSFAASMIWVSQVGRSEFTMSCSPPPPTHNILEINGDMKSAQDKYPVPKL
jgi:hypothetical protein